MKDDLLSWSPSLDLSCYDIRYQNGPTVGSARKHASDGLYYYYPLHILPYLQVNVLRAVADGIDRLNEKRHQQIEEDKAKKAAMAAVAAASDKQDRDDRVQKWARKNIHPGCMVKMSGCRDGKGFRQVMEYDKRTSYWDIIECRQIITFTKDANGFLCPGKSGQITSHYVNKLSKIFVEGKWESVSHLAKIEQNLGPPEQ